MAYRCPNKKAIGFAVYTNMVPEGAFRGYGASQTAFAIESAIDELGRELGIDPFTMRRKNMARAGDSLYSIWPGPDDTKVGSYGLDQCLDYVEKALASGRGAASRSATNGSKAKGWPFMPSTVRRPLNTVPRPIFHCVKTAPFAWLRGWQNSGMAP